MAKHDKDYLTNEILKKASNSAKRKMFKKDLPIVIVEDGKLYYLYKNNKKEYIKDIEPVKK